MLVGEGHQGLHCREGVFRRSFRLVRLLRLLLFGVLFVMNFHGVEDVFQIGESGDIVGFGRDVDYALRLEFAQVGYGSAEVAEGLGAGAVHGFLDLFRFLVCHGIEIEFGEVEFDHAAAAEAPFGGHDLGGEGFFESAFGGELGHD